MSLLDDRIKVATYAENEVIVEQGTTDKNMLILVLHGHIKLIQRTSSADNGEMK
jgi:hypothetical protein